MFAQHEANVSAKHEQVNMQAFADCEDVSATVVR